VVGIRHLPLAQRAGWREVRAWLGLTAAVSS